MDQGCNVASEALRGPDAGQVCTADELKADGQVTIFVAARWEAP